MKSPLKYVRDNILALAPYSTARDEYKGGEISVWLDANESPYDNGVNRYPDPHQHRLKAEIARLKCIDADCIFVGGAGSDEAIDLIYRIFCEPGIDNVVAIAPSYGVYAVAADINNIEYRQVMLGEDFSLPCSKLLEAADKHTKVMWICSPNNPTANAFETADIASLARSFDGMVVVDEAYVDFSERGSMLPMLTEIPNLIVMQTFSKAWGMAALRLGMAFCVPEIARIFGMVKYPYNVNGPTQEVVTKHILNDSIAARVAEIKRERARVQLSLGRQAYVRRVYPSDANFLLVKVDDADNLYDYLIDHGTIVRNRSKVKGCEGCLRITIGTPAENDILIQLLNQYQQR